MIYQHKDLTKGIVVNRPSKINKSPYLVDVKLSNDNNIYGTQPGSWYEWFN